MSPTWKGALIAWQSEKNTWIELRYQNKHYFGKYLSGPAIALPELRLMDQELKTIFTEHCQELSQEQIKLIIIPQLLVS